MKLDLVVGYAVAGAAWAVTLVVYPVAVAVAFAIAPGAAVMQEFMAAVTEDLDEQSVPDAER